MGEFKLRNAISLMGIFDLKINPLRAFQPIFSAPKCIGAAKSTSKGTASTNFDGEVFISLHAVAGIAEQGIVEHRKAIQIFDQCRTGIFLNRAVSTIDKPGDGQIRGAGKEGGEKRINRAFAFSAANEIHKRNLTKGFFCGNIRLRAAANDINIVPPGLDQLC